MSFKRAAFLVAEGVVEPGKKPSKCNFG